MKLLLIFIILNVLNVIIQTVKSIATIKCGKGVAAIVNALAYGLYTVVLVYMNCDLDLWAKVLVVGGANLVGVYVVKVMEEKANKEKVWKIEATLVKAQNYDKLIKDLDDAGISYNNFFTTKRNDAVFNCYSYSKEESRKIRQILKDCGAKYFVSESKVL